MTQSAAEQRDRFLTFAFAASDVLFEVDDDGRIVFAAGTVKALFGRSDKELMGAPFADLAVASESAVLFEYFQRLRMTGRTAEQHFTMDALDGTSHRVRLSGMTSPQRAGIHQLAGRRLPPTRAMRAEARDGGAMSVMDFSNAAAALATNATQIGESPKLAMYDLDWGAVERAVSKHDAKELGDAVLSTMRAWSTGDGDVGAMGKGKYSLLLDAEVDAEALSERLRAMAKEKHENLDLSVSHAALDISDVVDTDQFAAAFEAAMMHFDNVGGDAFDLKSFGDLPKDKPAPPTPPPSKNLSARQNAKRRGTVESWG
jgi:PAS domain S-box-containing protein